MDFAIDGLSAQIDSINDRCCSLGIHGTLSRRLAHWDFAKGFFVVIKNQYNLLLIACPGSLVGLRCVSLTLALEIRLDVYIDLCCLLCVSSVLHSEVVYLLTSRRLTRSCSSRTSAAES